MLNTSFIDDMSLRRSRARRCMALKCMSASSAAKEDDTQQAIIELLNEALATELLCVLRYKAHYYASHGFVSDGDSVKLADSDYWQQATEEQRHVDQLAERIEQLGGYADFNPQMLTERGYSDYTSIGSSLDTLQEDLIAARIKIDIYREMIRFVASRDSATRDVLQEVLQQEMKHMERINSRIESLRNTLPSLTVRPMTLLPRHRPQRMSSLVVSP